MRKATRILINNRIDYGIWMAIGLAIVFIGWIFYRLLIKKDLSENLNSLYLGLFFIAIWVLFYFLLLNIFKILSYNGYTTAEVEKSELIMP
jgi:high-affinity Fe2+/Pb2+ permease